MADTEGPSPVASITRLVELAEVVSTNLNADIIVYDGDIAWGYDHELIDACRRHKNRRENVVLMIHTHGGSADVAYRMVRHLNRAYEKFSLFVYSCCKSAGTLIACGADELIISDHGDLGPLDVQMAKPDELGEMSSGLTLLDALSALQRDTFAAWESHFLQIRAKSGLQITTKTASEIAAGMVGNLFAPIYSQIEPTRLGEVERATKIALEYGKRIGRTLQPDALARLIAGYPSHEFVIDREEAGELFYRVRPPSDEEEELSALVQESITPVVSKRTTPLVFLDEFIEEFIQPLLGNGEDNEAEDDRKNDEAGGRPSSTEEPRDDSTDPLYAGHSGGANSGHG